MTDISARLLEHGIRLTRGYEPGDHRTICPNCSAQRKKKSDPCLSITIDQDGGAMWNCWHCDLTGGTRAKCLFQNRLDR